LAAEKKGTTIVIKKIYNTGGGHGGSWKVALADFMTALMCFFLVMWLLAQSAETKKAVSDYFSAPSVIEYNFQNFGVEVTLDKLFLDLINEPLRAFQQFMEPIDKTPNLLDMGSEKVVMAYLADSLKEMATNVKINPDGVEFVLKDTDFFEPGTAVPTPKFTENMEKVKALTVGLEDSQVQLVSLLYNQSVVGSSSDLAKRVASERLDLVQKKLESSLEHSSVDVSGKTKVEDKKDFIEGQGDRPRGFIYVRLVQKELKSNGEKPRKIETLFGATDTDMSVYDNFVKQVTDSKKKKPNSVNPKD
jgi:chemotaxis protein MotB